MTTATSFSSGVLGSDGRAAFGESRLRHYFRHILRKNLGLCVFSFLYEFLCMPLPYILTAANMRAQENPAAESFFTGTGGLFASYTAQFLFNLSVIGLPLLYCTLQYAFLYRRQSTDLIHSLPIRRRHILLLNYAAGALLILMPLLANFLITLAAAFGFGSTEFSLPEAFLFLATCTISALALLSICTLVCVLSGTLFDSIVYSLGVYFFLPVLAMAAIQTVQNMLRGFVSPDGGFLSLSSPALLPSYLQNTFPTLARTQGLRAGAFGLVGGSARMDEVMQTAVPLFAALGIWLLLAAGLLFLALFCYDRRRSELSGRTGFNNPLTLLLKFSASILGGLLFSGLFIATSGSDAVWLRLLGSVFGSVLIYCVAECILARGFSTLRRALPMVGAGALLPVIFLVVLSCGGLGFEARLPAAENVEKVEIAFEDRYGFARLDLTTARQAQAAYAASGGQYAGYYGSTYVNTVTLEQESAKALVHDLHDALIRSDEHGGVGITLEYTMKNGSVLRREYGNWMNPEAMEFYNRLNAFEEVKRQTQPVFSFDAPDIESVTLMNRLMFGVTPAMLTEEQTQTLIEALRADILAETYDQMTDAKPLGYVCLKPRFFNVDGHKMLSMPLPAGESAFDDCYVLITDAYQNTLRLLTTYGYAGFDSIDFSEIDHAYASISQAQSSLNILQLMGPMYFSADDLDAEASYGPADYETLFVGSDLEVLLENAENSCYASRADISTERMAALEPSFASDNRVTVNLVLCPAGRGRTVELQVNPAFLPRDILEQFREGWKNDHARAGYAAGLDELFDALVDSILESGVGAVAPFPPEESEDTQSVRITNPS